jgi:hypothetical protein
MKVMKIALAIAALSACAFTAQAQDNQQRFKITPLAEMTPDQQK